MNTIRPDLLERFQKLDIATQERLLAEAEAPLTTSPTDFDALLDEMDAFRERLITKYGAGHFPPAVDMVRELREEEPIFMIIASM